MHDLTEIWDKLSSRSLLEDWHDAEDIREEALDLFRHGIIDLKTRAQIESLYWAISHEVAELAHHQKHVPDELRNLDKQMADKYFCNFSLFQSMPDSWGIDQLFPIMPIARLEEQPTRSATLQDITCDSDGKITAYVNGGQGTATGEKPRFAQLNAGQKLETITLEEALELFQLPKKLGMYEGEPIIIGAGKYGPYVFLTKAHMSLFQKAQILWI